MPKRQAAPPFPDSPGAWIACFRHRARFDGRPPSPEEFGAMIERSGATVRRWERNLQVPEDKDIERMAVLCQLSRHHVAFLTAACSRMRAMPAPDREDFVHYVDDVLSSVPYPAMVLDSLFYVRAWNSYLDALDIGLAQALRQDLHPLALMFRAAAELPFGSGIVEETLRVATRIIWMGTAVHSHSLEYRGMLSHLNREPGFRDAWMDLALGKGPGDSPIGLRHALIGQAPFTVYSRRISFPPTYFINEYHPADSVSQARLEAVRGEGPARVYFKRALHWVSSQSECASP